MMCPDRVKEEKKKEIHETEFVWDVPTRLLHVYELKSAMHTLLAFCYEFRKPDFCVEAMSCH